ncbi:MAG TPA: hypothetical protein VHG51_10200 [Longimicrobiaceae bacterium]|nr:hypothetical protein [Longimicrobiaceae bacterium]
MLVVHGIGQRSRSDFEELVEGLAAALGGDVRLVPVYWGDLVAQADQAATVIPAHEPAQDPSPFAALASEIQAEFLRDLRVRITDLVVPYLADALLYQKPAVRRKIRARLIESVPAGYGTRDRPISVIAHSLGGVVAFDAAVSGSPRLWIKNFVTLGSQAAFFHLQDPRGTLAAYTTGSAVKLPRTINHWINVSDRHDWLAFGTDRVFRLHDGVSPAEVGIESTTDLLRGLLTSHFAYWSAPPAVEAIGRALRSTQPFDTTGARSRLASLRELEELVAGTDLQAKVNAMEEVGLRALESPAVYRLLAVEARRDTSRLEGQARADADYVRQAALWTLGLIFKGRYADRPTVQFPGLDTIRAVVGDEAEDPEVRMAGVQALQILGRPNDPEVRAIVATAQRAGSADLTRLADGVLAGHTLPMPYLRAGGPDPVREASLEELERMMAAPDPQVRVDAMEQIALRGVGTARTYSLLSRQARGSVSGLEGLTSTDADYLRQAALWTLGMLNKAQHENVPTRRLPGMDVFQEVTGDIRECEDVRIAAIQALQVVHRPRDPAVRALLEQVRSDPGTDLQRIVQAALAGERIPLPGEP